MPTTRCAARPHCRSAQAGGSSAPCAGPRRRIEPALAPIERLLDYLADCGRTRPISLRAFHFLLAHGGAAPFTLAPLARHFDPTDPRDPEAVAEHADLVADLIVRGLQRDQA